MKQRGARLFRPAALAAVFISAASFPALAAGAGMALAPSHRAHALFNACRAYGEGRMPLARFVEAVENLTDATFPRLKFWLLLCGGT